MSKPVNKSLYGNYLQKAEEILDVAEYAAKQSKNNAAVTASVHCAINAIDALSVFYLGKRHSGGHEGAVDTVKGAVDPSEFKDMSRQFGGPIALKNEAEYQPDLMKAAQARDAVTKAGRILSESQTETSLIAGRFRRDPSYSETPLQHVQAHSKTKFLEQKWYFYLENDCSLDRNGGVLL